MRRRTRQRDAIASCFSRMDRPLTPAEIHEIALAEQPSLGIATVYRTIGAFVEEGVLSPISIGGVTRYELADQEHHYHFHCRGCDRAFCLDSCPVHGSNLAPKGFTVEQHELLVSGVCRDCKLSGKAAPEAVDG